MITKDLDIICDGTFYYPRARDIFSFLAKKQLLEQAVTLNIQGIFPEAEYPAVQLPLSGSGFNSFVELNKNSTFLRDAWRTISLRNRIAEIDQINMDAPPVSRAEEVKRYERDAVLVSLLKEFRGNKCQICGYTFMKRDGEYYSECHHLDSLGNGGFDISRNMLIVCANCHKRMHYAKVSIVEHKESGIIIDIDGDIYECSL